MDKLLVSYVRRTWKPASVCLGENLPLCSEAVKALVWSTLGIRVHGKILSKEVLREKNGENYGFHPHAKWRKVPQIGSSQHREKKGHCVGNLCWRAVFTSMWLGFCVPSQRTEELHDRWPSLKFVGILNKAELNSAFVQACKRRQRGQNRSETERKRDLIQEIWTWEAKQGKADAGTVSCHISISEGIVEESAREQRGWISTDWQNQGLMLSSRKKKMSFSSSSTQPEQ